MKDFKSKKESHMHNAGKIVDYDIFVRGFFLTPSETIRLAKWMLKAANYINQMKKENTMAKKKAAKSKKKTKK